MKKAIAEDPFNSSMIKKLISKTTDTKQNPFHTPFENLVTRNTIRRSYPYFT